MSASPNRPPSTSYPYCVRSIPSGYSSLDVCRRIIMENSSMTPLSKTFGIAARNFTAYPEMPDARALVDYGVKMEELGYDSLWVWDHILLGGEPHFPILD